MQRQSKFGLSGSRGPIDSRAFRLSVDRKLTGPDGAADLTPAENIFSHDSSAGCVLFCNG
jgi:hypothetical protein